VSTTNSAPVFLSSSLPDLAGSLARGHVTCREYAEESIRKYRQYEAEVRAWVCFDEEHVRREADEWDERIRNGVMVTPFTGIPFGVKDIFNTRAFPTEMGSVLWKRFTPGNNARVVDSLLNAGAIVAGKTVTAEFAVHHLNETVNPYDTSKTPGTSSSGSTVAVAVGTVPFALGTQTAGSITRPASFCGVWGMKPSFGLIPRTGVLKTTDSLDTIGFLAAHPRSLRPILDQIRVKGPDYPLVYRRVDARGAAPKPGGHPWKVGVVKTHTWNGAAEYARDAVCALARSIDATRQFTVEELELPEAFAAAHEIHPTIYNKSLAYYFEQESKHTDYVSPIMREMIDVGRAIDPESFRQALAGQERLANLLARCLEPYDLVLSLGTSSSAPQRGVSELPDPSLMWTLTYVPSVSVPAFACPEGMPFSCQFIAKRYDDYLLLQGLELLAEQGLFPRPRYRRSL
jgi:Asp-tRNA(Asn)/Glu-tRNA(Gln) amidotransferase A subunit family amidase